jgi:hypothetical protein
MEFGGQLVYLPTVRQCNRMGRPVGVTVIAALCFMAAVYLMMVAAVTLLAPGAISVKSAAPLMYGLELAGPYMMLIVGAAWGLLGWGLLRMQNWARWVAMLACGAGIAAAIPAVSSASDIPGMIWPSGVGIMLRAAVVWYLLQAPAVVDSFTRK